MSLSVWLDDLALLARISRPALQTLALARGRTYRMLKRIERMSRL